MTTMTLDEFCRRRCGYSFQLLGVIKGLDAQQELRRKFIEYKSKIPFLQKVVAINTRYGIASNYGAGLSSFTSTAD